MSHERARRYVVRSHPAMERRALQASRARARVMRVRIQAVGGSAEPEPDTDVLALWIEHEAALRLALSSARRPETLSERTQARADLLAIDAASIDDPEAQDLAEFISNTGATADLDDLEARVAEFRERSEAEEDRRFVIDRAREALRDLGYTVGEEFVEAALRGPVVVAAPSSPGVGIELDFQPGRSSLVTETVALTPDVDDLVAAQAGCAVMDALDEALKASGVEVVVESETPPGAHPLKRVGSATQSQARPRGGGTAQATGGA